MPLSLTDLVTGGGAVEGRLRQPIPIKAFPRLAETLLDPGGTVDVDIRVSRAPTGVPLIEGRMAGTFRPACQRCLEPVDMPIEVELRLAVTGASGLVPAGMERWESDEAGVILRDLLEDELILALPMVARHDDPAQCGDMARRADETAERPPGRENPFAVLRGLKRD